MLYFIEFGFIVFIFALENKAASTIVSYGK